MASWGSWNCSRVSLGNPKIWSYNNSARGETIVNIDEMGC